MYILFLYRYYITYEAKREAVGFSLGVPKPIMERDTGVCEGGAPLSFNVN